MSLDRLERLQRALAAALVVGIFLVALRSGMPKDEVARSTFFALVTAIVGLVFVNRPLSSSLILASNVAEPGTAWIPAGVAAILTLAPDSSFYR